MESQRVRHDWATELNWMGNRLPRWYSGKESACQCKRHKRCVFDPWVSKIPWRRKWQPTPVFFPGKFHGQRSLMGYNPWGCKELDMTDWTFMQRVITGTSFHVLIFHCLCSCFCPFSNFFLFLLVSSESVYSRYFLPFCNLSFFPLFSGSFREWKFLIVIKYVY